MSRHIIAAIFTIMSVCLFGCGKNEVTTMPKGNEAVKEEKSTESSEEKASTSQSTAQETAEEEHSASDAESDTPTLTVTELIRNLGKEANESKNSYWYTQGTDTYEYDSMIVLDDTLRFYFPHDGLYLFAEGALNDDELKEAGADEEDLDKWFEACQALILPKKYSYSDTPYFAYIRTTKDAFEPGTDLSDLRESESEELEKIMEQLSGLYGNAQIENVEYNGIEYLECYGESKRGVGELFLTVADGNLYQFCFDSFMSADNMQEIVSFIDYFMHSIYPNSITVEELDQTYDSSNLLSEEAVEYWEYLGRNVPKPDRRAVLADVIALPYASSETSVFISGEIDPQEAEKAGISSGVLEKQMCSATLDAIICPKDYQLSGDGYSCYVRIIQGCFDKGKELKDLKNESNEKLKELMKLDPSAVIQEVNGIEYATLKINTVSNGMVIQDLTVVDGNLITLTYTFSDDYMDEALAYRRYLLSSIIRM